MIIHKLTFEDTTEYRTESDKLHREDGPARIYNNGDETWWFNGKRHRIDGAAVKFKGKIEYWVDGIKYSESQFINIKRNLKINKLLNKN